ncbi:CocE/NonD family hydrolase [Streptomyces sp. GESEQ-35]|uniref:CocE/NonD family hydrolase n=1 Tax=Streptomyces sp. GESEQ-35 TaxID=2812657 RepID=UPI001B31A1F7|nr:CocE/NonD family hydrolase [Streptomyces sp. GESEQ-35]
MAVSRQVGPPARALGALYGKTLGLPPVRTRYSIRSGIRVPTRDDAELLTDHYIPEQNPRGTVLIRSPYGRGVPLNWTHGRMLAARGYHVLVQSVRGTAGSTGMFRPIVQESQDAQDTLEWLRAQQWFDGHLATFGGSYLGWAQWALLQDPPPELRAAVVLVGPHDFQQAMYGTGSLALADLLTWSAMVGAQGDGGLRGLRGLVTARRRLAAAWAEPTPAEAAASALKGTAAAWFSDWLDHSAADDPFWAGYRADSALEKVDVPVLLLGGWQDVFLDQTLHQYRTLRRHNPSVALTIGPWTHMDTAAKAARVVDRQLVRWLDQNLGGDAATAEAPVQIYQTGARTWLRLPDWPPAGTERVLWPRPDGGLGHHAAEGTVGYRYDPADPTPSVGGRHMRANAGTVDNRSLERRADVLTFTTEALAEPVDVIGAPTVELEFAADNPHADVFVRLCDVDGRSRSRVITERFARLSPAPLEPSKIRLELGACAHRFAAGHRMRLQISGGAYPRFARNSGTDKPGSFAAVAVRIGLAASNLTLPVPGTRPDSQAAQGS